MPSRTDNIPFTRARVLIDHHFHHRWTITSIIATTASPSPTSSIHSPHASTTAPEPRLARPRGHQVLPTPSHAAANLSKGLSPTEQDTSGLPPGATFGERRGILTDRKPCSKASGAASEVQVAQTGHKATTRGKNFSRGCTIEMHQAAVIAGPRAVFAVSYSTFSHGLKAPAVCHPPRSGAAMGGFRCRLGWCLSPGAVFQTAAPHSVFFMVVVVVC